MLSKKRKFGARKFKRRTRARAKKRTYSRVTLGELKFHDLDIDDATIATGGTIAEDSVLTIAQGTTESERIGRKVQVKQINWRFQILLPTTATAADTSDAVRVILYLDKQANGAAAGVTAILESSNFQSFNNLSNKSRFRTLMDRTYELNIPAGSGRGSTDTLSYGEYRIQDTFFKPCDIGIEYDNSATTGAITTMRSNNIGVLLLSVAGVCSFTSKMRVRYSDG